MIQTDAERQRAGGVPADRNIYVDADGNEVNETSPNVRQQLYGQGAMMTAEHAKQYGVKAPRATRAAESSQAGGDGGVPERLAALESRVAALEAASGGDAVDIEKSGQVGKDAPAPENKSGVPAAESTKETKPAPAKK